MANFFQDNPEYSLDNTWPIQPAGTTHGPCVNVNCGHIRCEGKRRVVYSRCGLCRKIIGYGARFAVEGTSFDTMGLVHADCVNSRVLPAGHNYALPTSKPRQLAAAKKALPPPKRHR